VGFMAHEQQKPVAEVAASGKASLLFLPFSNLLTYLLTPWSRVLL
jgi:hypothetical protein